MPNAAYPPISGAPRPSKYALGDILDLLDPPHRCVRTGLVYKCSCGWLIEPGVPDTAKVDAFVSHIYNAANR